MRGRQFKLRTLLLATAILPPCIAAAIAWLPPVLDAMDTVQRSAEQSATWAVPVSRVAASVSTTPFLDRWMPLICVTGGVLICVGVTALSFALRDRSGNHAPFARALARSHLRDLEGLGLRNHDLPES